MRATSRLFNPTFSSFALSTLYVSLLFPLLYSFLRSLFSFIVSPSSSSSLPPFLPLPPCPYQNESSLGGGELREVPLVAVGSPDPQAVPGLESCRQESCGHEVALPPGTEGQRRLVRMASPQGKHLRLMATWATEIDLIESKGRL